HASCSLPRATAARSSTRPENTATSSPSGMSNLSGTASTSRTTSIGRRAFTGSPASWSAFVVGHDRQMDKALELLREAIRREPPVAEAAAASVQGEGRRAEQKIMGAANVH